MPIRDCEITNVQLTDIPPEWPQVADKVVFGRPYQEIDGAVFAEFALAEEVIGLLRYKQQTGFSYEVGIGEPLRPYQRLYFGMSAQDAEERFWQAVTMHVRNM
jgi:hypothetical protein